MHIVIFVKFSANENIFINIFEQFTDEHNKIMRFPVFFKTLNSTQIINKQIKINIEINEKILDFCEIIKEWFILKYIENNISIQQITFVLNNFAYKIKKFGQQNYHLDELREKFCLILIEKLDEFPQFKDIIEIKTIIDNTGIPFNGCKKKKFRRKKRKHFTKC